MIEIRKVENPDIARKICVEAGTPWNEQTKVIANISGSEILQFAVFSYDGEMGHILALGGFEGGLTIQDGLCRAILNIMDLNGVKEVSLPIDFQKLAQKLGGFKEKNGEYHLKLAGFFCCNCKKGNMK